MPQSLAGQPGILPKTQTLLETLSRAAAVAGEYSHRVVTLEHLLYALLDDPDAVSVLQACHVDLPRLKNSVIEFLIHGLAGLRSPDHAQSFLSSDVETVIVSATVAAEQSGRSQIDGAIVLAAIIGGGGTTAAQILSNFGVTFDEAVNSLRIRDPLQNAPATQYAPQPSTPPAQHLPAGQGPYTAALPPPARIDEVEPTVDDIMASVRDIIGVSRAQTKKYAQSAQVKPVQNNSVQNEPDDFFDAEFAVDEPAEAQQLEPVQNAQQHKAGIPVGRDSYRAPPPASPSPYGGQSRQPPRSIPASPVPTNLSAPPPAMPPEPQRPAYANAPIQETQQQAQARQQAPVPPPNVEHSNDDQGTLPISRRHGEAPDSPRSKGMVDSGQLIENIPRKMRVGVALTVEVRVGRSHIEDLDQGMGGAPANRHVVGVTQAMTLQLRAPQGGFIIAGQTPETQWIDNMLGAYDDDFASWRWTVTPMVRGRKRLQLILSARTIDARGMVAETAMPEQVITVKVRINYFKTALNIGGWALAAIVGGFLSQYGEEAMRWVKVMFAL